MSQRQVLKPWINDVNLEVLREVVGQTTLAKHKDEAEDNLRKRVYREQKNHADYRMVLSKLVEKHRG